MPQRVPTLTRILQRLLHDDATSEDLEPLALPKNFHLVARGREWEECVDPSDLQRISLLVSGAMRAKQVKDERVERELKILRNEVGSRRVVYQLIRILVRDARLVLDDEGATRERSLHGEILVGEDSQAVGREHACTLHLVEDGIMRCIDLVPAVDIGSEKPGIVARGKRLDFVCGRVCPQHVLFVQVVRVGE